MFLCWACTIIFISTSPTCKHYDTTYQQFVWHTYNLNMYRTELWR